MLMKTYKLRILVPAHTVCGTDTLRVRVRVCVCNVQDGVVLREAVAFLRQTRTSSERFVQPLHWFYVHLSNMVK